MPERLVRQLSDAESELLADVLHVYGLTGPASDLVRIAVWGDRFVAAFSVTEGCFFLKEWSSFHETEDEIAFCLDIQETARRGGVPAPRIYRTTSGERTYTSGNRRFALHQFLGEAYDPAYADAQLSSCTQVLGLLHRATTGATIVMGTSLQEG